MPKSEIDKLVAEIARNRETIKELEEEVKEMQAELVSYMADSETNKVETKIGNVTYGATLVESTSVILDETKFKKRVGGIMWGKITTKVLDKKKLEAFVAAGEIDPNVVAACSNEIKRSPHVRITTKVGSAKVK